MVVTATQLEQECRIRERFIRDRLTRPAAPDELKDLTDFFHQAHADILSCNGCSLLFRQERELAGADSYSEDPYDHAVMERQYPDYVAAFRKKEQPYRELLAPGAHVIEVGSHYGAFLQVAQEWGWNVEGVDVGKETSAFARSKGFPVHNCELTGCGFPSANFDGVFVWNCFEQIADPEPLLTECRRVLKTGGLLVLRTPNGLFYRTARSLLHGEGLDHSATKFLTEALGYNNLLGFPYLYGHRLETLAPLVERFGFAREGALNSELLTLPLPESPAWVDSEERIVNDETRLLAQSVLSDTSGTLLGPWMEVWLRTRA